MHAPPAPTSAAWLPTFRIEIVAGGTTVIVMEADCLPTLSVMVAVVGDLVAGAVQRKFVELGPLRVPMLAVHVPATLPVKSTTSPTPTRVRVAGAPDGAAFTAALVMVGAADAAGRRAAGRRVPGLRAPGRRAAGLRARARLSPIGPARSSASTAVDPERCGDATGAGFSVWPYGEADDLAVINRCTAWFPMVRCMWRIESTPRLCPVCPRPGIADLGLALCRAGFAFLANVRIVDPFRSSRPASRQVACRVHSAG
jgi:hypothetical protein